MMALGDNPPPAGAFCLASYYHLEPSESVISCVPRADLKPWKGIEISYVRIEAASAGNASDDTSEGLGAAHPAAVQASHFLVCGGIIGSDGKITATEMWRQQQVTPAHGQGAVERKIRVCVVVGSHMNRPTDLQTKRTQALVTTLSREFGISPDSISHRDWQ
jgi:hypothetical protein